jgi:hypothetical protein
MRPLLIFFACLALYFSLLSILALLADAVTLSISGHISGQGFQNLSYAGDLLNVNISQNATGWNLSLFGGSA